MFALLLNLLTFYSFCCYVFVAACSCYPFFCFITILLFADISVSLLFSFSLPTFFSVTNQLKGSFKLAQNVQILNETSKIKLDKEIWEGNLRHEQGCTPVENIFLLLALVTCFHFSHQLLVQTWLSLRCVSHWLGKSSQCILGVEKSTG